MQQYNHVWLSFSYCFSPNGSISVVDILTVSTTLTADIKFALLLRLRLLLFLKNVSDFFFFFVFFFATTIYFLHFKSSFFS